MQRTEVECYYFFLFFFFFSSNSDMTLNKYILDIKLVQCFLQLKSFTENMKLMGQYISYVKSLQKLNLWLTVPKGVAWVK